MQLFLTLLPFLLLAASLIGVVVLFYGLSKRFAKLRSRLEKCEARIDAESSQLANGINAIRGRVDDLEEGRPAADTTVSVASGSGVNSALRSKVLKMHRLGQTSDKISDTLRVPRGEIDLLIKVHRIVMRPYESPANEGLAS